MKHSLVIFVLSIFCSWGWATEAIKCNEVNPFDRKMIGVEITFPSDNTILLKVASDQGETVGLGKKLESGVNPEYDRYLFEKSEMKLYLPKSILRGERDVAIFYLKGMPVHIYKCN